MINMRLETLRILGDLGDLRDLGDLGDLGTWYKTKPLTDWKREFVKYLH